MSSLRVKSRALRKAFILGDPIEHSLSPDIHGYWLREHGIDGSYEAFNVPPAYLAKTLRKLAAEGYVGGNITIPHKEKALMLCDELSDAAREIGAVNTIIFKDGKVFGDNTDAYGFMENIVSRETFAFEGKKALVLGAGGASRAVVYALQKAGSEVLIANRTAERAEKLAENFGCGVLDWGKLSELNDIDFLVNTTSLGMEGQDALSIDLTALPSSALVTDIVYNPLETELLKQANERDLKAVDGLGMLLHQAVPGFEKWFGARPEVTPDLRDSVLKALKAREEKWVLKEGV